jgi:hypothetical protein
MGPGRNNHGGNNAQANQPARHNARPEIDHAR